MIYLKNNTEKQTIFIPRNELQKEAFITTIRTYEDGLKEGYGNGIEDQKDQLLNLYVTENGTYEREDGYGKVTVVIEGGTDCKEAIETAYEDGYKEGYEDGAASIQIDLENKSIDIVSNGEYTVTPTDGFDALESVKISVDVQNGGKCNLEDKIIAPQTNEVDDNGWIYVYPNEGYDGMKEVALQTNQLKNGWYNEGYEQGKSEGGECNLEEIINTPQISEVNEGYLYYNPSEGYNGLSRVVIQTGDLRNAWYNEGYNEGVEQGGGGSELVLGHNLEVIETNGRHIFYPQNNGWNGFDLFEVEVNVPTTAKLQDVWVTPSMNDVDGNNLLVYTPNTDEGYDGLSRVVVNPNTIYKEGYDSGRDLTDYIYNQITLYSYRNISFDDFEECFYDSNNEPITDVLVVVEEVDFEYSFNFFTKVPIKTCLKIPYPNNALYGLTRLYFKNIPSVRLNYKDNNVVSLYVENVDYLNMNETTLNGLLRIWLKGSTTFSEGLEIGTAQIKNSGTIYSDGTNTDKISSSFSTWTIINDHKLP